VNADGDARRDAGAAGFGKGEDAARASADALTTAPVLRVRSEKFSWLSRKVLIESRNDQFAKLFHDVVLDERPRWTAAQRAAGVDPDFVVDRRDLAAFKCLLLGDPGEGDVSQWAVARALPSDNAFAVVVSDVVYAAGDVNQYVEKFYEPFAAYPHVIYALPGNHDWYDGLDGFMFHFCGSEPLPRVSYRAGSFPLREWLARVLWRKASRPDREALLGRRAARPPFDEDPPRAPLPAPYWCLETEHLALVAIDTGILGTIDHEQGEWLVRISRAIAKPKVLLTGKPLYVSGKYAPCEIKWGAGAVPEFPTVDSVVRHEEFRYVAAIGGDVHNYQRYPLPSGGRTVQYVVSGGAGAYMSQTHTIPRAEDLPGPDGAPGGATEADSRLYPLRGDSLAMYTQQLVVRAPRWLAQVVLLLAAAAGLVYLLAQGSSWPLWKAGLFTGGIGVLQAGYGMLGPRERRLRVAGYGIALLAVGIALVLFDRHWRSGLSHGEVTTWLVGATIGLPVLCVALVGATVRRFAIGLGVLLALALVAWVVRRPAIETGVRVAVVSVSAVLVCVALRGAVLAAAAGYARRGVGALLAIAGVAGGACAAFLAWDFGDVLAALLGALTLVVALYVVAIGLIPTALVHRGRRIEDDTRLANHASKFVALRLGLAPVRADAAGVDRVDTSY
jgi:hypothetical protein